MSRLNLPPIKRRKPAQQKISSDWNTGLPSGWYLSPRDVMRFESMSFDASTVRQMIEDIGEPIRINLSDYIYSARLAGVDPKAFIEIARSGVMSSPPSLTVLRQYLGACDHDPLLAMLAYRVKLSPQELADLKQDGELNVQNLRAMIDLM